MTNEHASIQVSSPDVEEIKTTLDSVQKTQKEILKQFGVVQRSLDAIYADRDLITDVINDVEKVRRLVIHTDKHNEQLSQKVSNTVEQKTEQVKAEVEITSSEVKNTIVQRVIHDIKKTFNKENATLIKRPWWKRLTFQRKVVTPSI